MKSKQGQLGGLPTIVAAIVVVGILLGAGYFIMQEFQEIPEFSDTLATVYNETGLPLNTTDHAAISLQNASGFNTFVVLAVYNASGTQDEIELIPASNYTVNADTGVLTSNGENWTSVNVSYTYLYGETSYEGIEDTITGMNTVPDLLPLLILILMVGIILTILFMVLPGGRTLGA